MRQQRILFADLGHDKPWVGVASSLTAPIVLESVTQVADLAAVQTLAKQLDVKARYSHTVAGCYPASRFMRHAILDNPSKAREEGFFEEYLKAEYKVDVASHSVAIISATQGTALDLEKVVPKEVVFCGAVQADLAATQQSLVEHMLYPERLELGTVATVGGVMNYLRAQQITNPTVVLEWANDHTLLMIPGPKKLELVRVIPFGTQQLLEQISHDLGLKDEVMAHKFIASGSFDFAEMGATLLKRFIKELQASTGFFEVQTGQTLKNFIITQLPEHLGWVEGVLASFVGLEPLTIDYIGWANTVGIKAGPQMDFSKLTRAHLPLFSLMLPQTTESDGEKRSS